MTISHAARREETDVELQRLWKPKARGWLWPAHKAAMDAHKAAHPDKVIAWCIDGDQAVIFIRAGVR